MWTPPSQPVTTSKRPSLDFHKTSWLITMNRKIIIKEIYTRLFALNATPWCRKLKGGRASGQFCHFQQSLPVESSQWLALIELSRLCLQPVDRIWGKIFNLLDLMRWIIIIFWRDTESPGNPRINSKAPITKCDVLLSSNIRFQRISKIVRAQGAAQVFRCVCSLKQKHS